MLFPVLGLLDQAVTPAVRPWYLEAFECGWARTRCEGFDTQCVGAEDVYDVS